MKSIRFVDEKIPSCENCIYYSASFKKNSKGELIEMAHGKCFLRNKPYKQRHEVCKQWHDKCDSI